MSWEALSAISSAVTALVICLTAIYASRQVRAMNAQSGALTAQLEHLRRATQLDGTLAIFEELYSPDMIASYRFIMAEYDERMTDETYRREAMEDVLDPDTHHEVPLLRHLERIGTIVKNDLLDAEVFLDLADHLILDAWSKLEALTIEHRRVFNDPHLWENFEFLARASIARRKRMASLPNG